MIKKIGIVVGIVAVGFVGALWYLHEEAPVVAPSVSNNGAGQSAVSVPDPKNGTYIIENASVTLAAGSAESPAAPGSASMIATKFFGNEATGDLNGDGVADEAFLVTQSGGGSGTFYYVAALVSSADGYHGTNAIALGDRIAPQTTEIKDGEVIVNYADRPAGAPMTAQPSVGVSKYFKIQGGTLIEAAQ